MLTMWKRCLPTPVQPQKRQSSLSLSPSWNSRWGRRGGLSRLRPTLQFKWYLTTITTTTTTTTTITITITILMVLIRWCSQVLEPLQSSSSWTTSQTQGDPCSHQHSNPDNDVDDDVGLDADAGDDNDNDGGQGRDCSVKCRERILRGLPCFSHNYKQGLPART